MLHSPNLTRTVRVPVAEVFAPFLTSEDRYKVCWGGRGSGKSHFFADHMVDAHLEPGEASVCIREVQKSLKDSAKKLIETKIAERGLTEADGFKCWNEVTETPGDGLIVYMGMKDHTAESVKSLEGMKRSWVEEARSLSATSLQLLRPTIRAPGSQMWFSYNPQSKRDAVDLMFRGPLGAPSNSLVIRANWDDNPWWNDVLEAERLDTLEKTPEHYAHIWEGDYASVVEGAYFAHHLIQARAQGRIGFVPQDPLARFTVFWDLGGTGKRADATAAWVMQVLGAEMRVVDYYEAQGQPFSAHVAWLLSRGYVPGRTHLVLPHDGAKHDIVYSTTPSAFLDAAGFTSEIIPNQGTGAAMARVDAARLLFSTYRFNEPTTSAGLEALGYYHEKRDEKRNIGLGPEHDWASHGADGFGLSAVWRAQNPSGNSIARRPRRAQSGWTA